MPKKQIKSFWKQNSQLLVGSMIIEVLIINKN